MINRISLDRSCRVKLYVVHKRMHTMVFFNIFFCGKNDPDIFFRRVINYLLNFEHPLLHTLYSHKIAKDLAFSVFYLFHFLFESWQISRYLLYNKMLLQLTNCVFPIINLIILAILFNSLE